MRQKAMPYPWFFYVWTLLYFGSIPCGVFLLFYVLYKFVGVLIGGEYLRNRMRSSMGVMIRSVVSMAGVDI